MRTCGRPDDGRSATVTGHDGGAALYGLIGKMTAVPGERSKLVAALLRIHTMPGCAAYLVAEDATDPNGVWVTEIWESEDHHIASLQLPEVQAAVAAGRDLITGFDVRATTTPIGGIGWSLLTS